MEVVPNGIDLDRFAPDVTVPDWRARCGFSSVPLVTYLGRLTVDKGVHRFLDAVADARARTDVVAVVGGAGPEEAAVRARIRDDPRLRGIARYVGPVAEEEKPALLGQSDVFVLPSTSDTSSIALLEAMACATAVIGPAEGGAAELLEDGRNGRRVPVLEPGALAAALVQLADDPVLRRSLGAHGREYVRERASVETMARRFIFLYEHLIEARSSNGSRSPG